jgi:hypothetical protein
VIVPFDGSLVAAAAADAVVPRAVASGGCIVASSVGASLATGGASVGVIVALFENGVSVSSVSNGSGTEHAASAKLSMSTQQSTSRVECILASSGFNTHKYKPAHSFLIFTTKNSIY